jgi:hypothetical protein
MRVIADSLQAEHSYGSLGRLSLTCKSVREEVASILFRTMICDTAWDLDSEYIYPEDPSPCIGVKTPLPVGSLPLDKWNATRYDRMSLRILSSISCEMLT